MLSLVSYFPQNLKMVFAPSKDRLCAISGVLQVPFQKGWDAEILDFPRLSCFESWEIVHFLVYCLIHLSNNAFTSSKCFCSRKVCGAPLMICISLGPGSASKRSC